MHEGWTLARIVPLEAGIFVAPQLVEADFADIAARGFRSIVNNRPDGEAPDQLPSARVQAISYRHGLIFRAQPVANCSVTEDDVVSAFEQLMHDLPRPILFYCRSGTRCAILWAQAAAVRLGVDRVLSIADEAGFDLEILRDTLNERSSASFDVPAQQEKDMHCSLPDA
jgi:sulfide:quinone oxidoreductase